VIFYRLRFNSDIKLCVLVNINFKCVFSMMTKVKIDEMCMHN